MAPSLEQIFHTEPKKIGMVEIYSNPMDRSTVKDIERVINSIAKSFHINLDDIPSGEALRVYIYPTSRVFFSIFGYELEKKGRRRLNKGKEELYFVVGEGEIHMVSPRGVANSYTDMIKILVKDILEEYGLDDKTKKAEEKVKEELEPEEIEEEENELEGYEEELEEEKLEEDLDEIPEEADKENIEEISDKIEEIDDKIEEIKKEKDVPEWLDLGWIMYKKGILKSQKNSEDYGEYIKEHGVMGQEKISSKHSAIADYNYSSESAAAIVEYIVQNYGVRKILDLFENPNVEQVLGISKAKFSRECKANIKKRYVTSKVKEVVDVKEEPENPEKIKEN